MPSPKKSEPSKKEQEEMGFRASYSSGDFSYCCGGVEFGNFCCSEQRLWQQNYYSGWTKQTVYPTRKEAWEVAFSTMRDKASHEGDGDDDDDGDGFFPMMFNLIEGNTETQDLEDLIKSQHDYRHILRWLNPNTGNWLNMYILTNGAKEK